MVSSASSSSEGRYQEGILDGVGGRRRPRYIEISMGARHTREPAEDSVVEVYQGRLWCIILTLPLECNHQIPP